MNWKRTAGGAEEMIAGKRPRALHEPEPEFTDAAGRVEEAAPARGESEGERIRPEKDRGAGGDGHGGRELGPEDVGRLDLPLVVDRHVAGVEVDLVQPGGEDEAGGAEGPAPGQPLREWVASPTMVLGSYLISMSAQAVQSQPWSLKGPGSVRK